MGPPIKDLNVWHVPRDWGGETVVIIGGGASVNDEQIEIVRQNDCKVIAINDAYLVAPWADILYAADVKWWNWHEGAPGFDGIKVGLRYSASTNALEGDWTEELYPDIKSLIYDRYAGVSTVPGLVRSGRHGGYQAIQLAVQLGAKKIILLGYDMKSESIEIERDKVVAILDLVLGMDYPTLKREAIAAAMRDIKIPHWHGHHPDEVPPPYDLFLKQYASMDMILKGMGVEVTNCTPGSELHEFWEADLKEAIENVKN